MRNRTPSNLKLQHRSKNPSKFCLQEDGTPLANMVLCLSDCTSPWHIDPHTHGILTPFPWYIDTPTHGISIPTHGILTPYPWYKDPLTRGILTPYHWYMERLTYGISKLLPMVYRPLPMVF